MYRIKSRDLKAPVLEAILPSNELQKQRGIELVRRFGKQKIGVLGLSFKSSTDDLRESPSVELIETLLGQGYDVCVYDPNIKIADLLGSNQAYAQQHLPHIANLLCDSLDALMERAEVVVVARVK